MTKVKMVPPFWLASCGVREGAELMAGLAAGKAQKREQAHVTRNLSIVLFLRLS